MTKAADMFSEGITKSSMNHIIIIRLNAELLRAVKTVGLKENMKKNETAQQNEF